MPKYAHKRKRTNFYSPYNQRKVLKQIADQAINRTVETKTSVFSSTDGTEIAHNNFITLDSQILKTTPGPFDPTLTNADNRIGDKVTLRGVSMKMMFELNERFSDVTMKVLVVKCAKGDTPTRATLFNGLSGNKMLDTMNTERYTVLASKTFKMTSPNNGAEGSMISATGFGDAGALRVTQDTISRATRIIKMWIPGKKFVKSGVLTYEQGSSQPKFFDYHVLVYAYSNYSTFQDTWNVARLNDYIKQMYYKDA